MILKKMKMGGKALQEDHSILVPNWRKNENPKLLEYQRTASQVIIILQSETLHYKVKSENVLKFHFSILISAARRHLKTKKMFV